MAANIYSTELHSHPKKHGYIQMKSDISLFAKPQGGHSILVGISMDDFLPIATTQSLIDDLYKILQKSTSSSDWDGQANALFGQ